MRIWSAFQQAIFRFVAEGRGHGVVIARAGSGKTSVIVESFEHVPRGKTVAMMAFNKSIAEELSARAPAGVQVMTLHQYGFKAVNYAAGYKTPPKLERNKNQLLMSERLAADLEAGGKRAELANDHMRAACKAASFAKGCLASSAQEIDDILDKYEIQFEGQQDPSVRQTIVGHVLWLLDRGRDLRMIDFDDMIWLPVVLKLRPRQFDRVFIDETQDLNACQVELALMACKYDGRVLAVGDPMQAIYSWRGADEKAVDHLVERLSAKTMPLSITYRCPKSVVEIAKKIVPDLEAGPSAEDGSVESIPYAEMLKSVRPGDFVLSRTNAPLLSLAFELLKAGRRCSVAGRDIGANLVALIRRLGAESVPDLAAKVDQWALAECQRLAAKKPPADTQSIEDKAECLHALMEGAKSVAEVVAQCEALFSDETNGGRILLSSTHRAKGLERERVHLLEWTYRRGRSVEEDNLFYVAVTRAKSELYFVKQPVKPADQDKQPRPTEQNGLTVPAGRPVPTPEILKQLPKKPPRRVKK